MEPMGAALYLQTLGVAAAPMLRVSVMQEFSYFQERSFLQLLAHPHLNEEYVTECAPVNLSRLAPPQGKPAPLMGEQTREVAAQLLGLASEEIDRHISEGVLFEPSGIAC
jgi:crotonobetainyl-CoA:carnitine CoA-transferase CaiB-like acyl-CoA transferase